MFSQIKQVMAKETMLYLPDYSRTFNVHIDASDYQMGDIAIQDKQPLTIIHANLTQSNQNTKKTEQELLGIVETLKNTAQFY